MPPGTVPPCAVFHIGLINGGTTWSALRRLVMDAFQHCFNTGDIFEKPLMGAVQVGKEVGHRVGVRVIAMEMLCSQHGNGQVPAYVTQYLRIILRR